MNKVNFLTAAALTITMTMLAGCGDKKIDGSSDESLQESAKVMFESLPDNQKNQFVKAITMGKIMGISEKGKTFAASIDGKNAEEVIDYVNKGIAKKTTLPAW